jgi:hypothetical protein
MPKLNNQDILKANQWKKGHSGNPKGRPKLPNLKDIIAAVLADEKNGTTAAEAILMAMRGKAIKGDVKAAQLLLDRAYGQAKQHISSDVNVNALPPLTIKYEPE